MQMDTGENYGTRAKQPSARERANCLSRLIFWYAIKLFRRGREKDLDESDIADVENYHRSDKLGLKLSKIWSKAYAKAKNENKKPSMLKVVFKCFWSEILGYGLILLIMEMTVRLAQPLFIGLLIRYFMDDNKNNTSPAKSPMYIMRVLKFWETNQSAIQLNEAYFYAAGILLTNIIIVMTWHPYILCVLEIGLRIRIACCSLLYRKGLRIRLTELGGKTVGNVVNLMSNDVSRFDVAPIYFHYLWIAPIQSGVILYFLYRQCDEAALYGFIVIIIVALYQICLGMRTAKLRAISGERTDLRVMQMNEIIQAMQVIKMYAWEYAFSALISRLRKKELNILLQTSWIRGVIMSFIMFTTRSAIFLTVLVYVMDDKQITAEKVFVITSYYQIMRMTMTVYFPQGVNMLAESLVAMKRIQRFMLTEETKIGDSAPLDPEGRNKVIPFAQNQDPSSSLKSRDESLSPDITSPYIKVVRGIAKYGTIVCLNNINFECRAGELIAIVGPVGAGKSVILKVILGELSLFSGKICVRGTVSYASQESWLFAGSVRQNILFGREFEISRYKKVCEVCNLVRDFSLLPFGDRTIVGERGISLSGGQRARVNLARAVYKEADIYLLDDPLSAVDITVGQSLFENCIKSYLGDKIVILITHQLQYLKRADLVLVLSEGQIVAKGTYNEVIGQNTEYTSLIEKPTTNVVEEKEVKVFRSISIASAIFNSMIDIEGKKEKPVVFAEMRTLGAVDLTNYKEYFLAGAGNYIGVIGLILLFILSQFCASGGDYFLSKWVSLEELRYHYGTAQSMGFWNSLSRNDCIIVFSIFMAGTVLAAIIRSLTFFAVCMRASMRLHKRMFEAVIKAQMQFFNLNTSGRILNRFSKDLGSVDEFLPYSFIDTAQVPSSSHLGPVVQLLLNLVGALIVVGIIEVYLLVPTALMLIAFYLLRRVYLATSRNVKRLEGIAKSPMFAHLGATLQGLPTIRSNGAEAILVKEFDQLQDIHSSVWFMFLYCSRAFGLWLDLFCAFFVGIVSFSFIIFENEYQGSAVGLAITQCIGLSGLIQWGMRQSAELENLMTSVERILEFTKVEQESNLESKPENKPPDDWPQNGKIEFEWVSLRYSRYENAVLKDLQFVIRSREKIGIVGRTGAGKSSLLSALFRLAFYEGEVLIDDLDIQVLGLHDLRRKISIIPQEPTIFSGTLRYNLDPFNEYTDEAIYNCLLDVELRNAIIYGISCLDEQMSEKGENLSLGQRQMVCLARAILRNNIILVMDEATANVDVKTDKFIQDTIRTKFSHCTVLTIAHRLHTIMDSDRVLVMDAGRCVEFDAPYHLLQNPSSIFAGMVKKTGPATAQHLKKIAEEHYKDTMIASDTKLTEDDPQPGSSST